MVCRSRLLMGFFALALLFAGPPAVAAESVVGGPDGPAPDAGGENASNPLAKVANTDIRWQYLDLADGRGRINDYFIDGAFMMSPRLKVKYELHYNETNVTGSSESDFESALVKLIYFPTEGILDSGVRYRVAFGADLIADFDNQDKGIGTGADQLGPFAGMAFSMPSGLTAIPLVQHFTSVGGGDLNTTAARLIAIQPLSRGMWLKADVKIPYDWENDTIPASGELQLGINLNERLALYVDGLAGIGGDRTFDWGIGTGLRIKY